MLTVVGVRFKKAGKVYYFDPGELSIEKGNRVIVETARGAEFGDVVVGPKQVGEHDVIQPLKQVVRVASQADVEHMEKNMQKAKEAFDITLEKIEKHSLPMKLIDSEYTFDDSKLIFYFTADGRVDFRELVKDLASIFKTRIELRQIGVRDEAKMIGGLGPCGRPLCCSSFLGDFEPVSIRMAKEQGLSLNPTKISGICGRLMCCLKYEAEMYKEAREEKSSQGSTPFTDHSEARVDKVGSESRSVSEHTADEKNVLAIDKAEEIAKDKSTKSTKSTKSSKNGKNSAKSKGRRRRPKPQPSKSGE